MEVETRIALRLLSVSFPECYFSNTSKLLPNNPPFHEVHPLIGEIISRELDADPIQNEDLPCIDVEKVQSKVHESASFHPSPWMNCFL